MYAFLGGVNSLMELLGDFTMHHHIVTVTMEIDHRPCFVVDNLDFYCDLTRMVYCTVNVMGTKQTDPPLCVSFSRCLILSPPRHGEQGGPGAGGAGVPYALPPGLPRVPPRDDEAVLEEGP